MLSLIASAPTIGLLVPPAPTMAQVQIVQSRVPLAQLEEASSPMIFPTTMSLAASSVVNRGAVVGSIDDILEQEAAAATAKQEAIAARKAALKAAEQKAEAEAEAKYEAQKKLDEQKLAAAQKAAELRKEKAAAAAQAKAESKAGQQKAATKAAGSKPSNKYGGVEKIDKQAQRIKARQEAGGEAPSLFGV